jgi:ketosteroid isomerase-like protein
MDQRQVLEFLRRFEAAQATKSFAAVKDMIHPEALFRFRDGDHRGADAVRRAFEATWAHEVKDDRYEMMDVQVISLDTDSAVATFGFVWSGEGEKGRFRIEGRGTAVVVRRNEDLVLRLEHLSR